MECEAYHYHEHTHSERMHIMHHRVEQINVRYLYLINRTNRASLEMRLTNRWQRELHLAVTMFPSS